MTATREIPALRTDRLLLRPFVPSDALAVRELAGAREVADTTLSIPHPYPEGAAERWIHLHEADARAGVAFTWAITRAGDGVVLGQIELGAGDAHHRADIGY